MRRGYQVIAILAVIISTVLIIYGVSYCRWSIFEDGIKGIRSYRFQLEMSIDEAKEHFSSYGKLTQTVERTEEKHGKATWLTYESMDETLVLKFTNDKLYGFSYVNWQIR